MHLIYTLLVDSKWILRAAIKKSMQNITVFKKYPKKKELNVMVQHAVDYIPQEDKIKIK